MSNAPPQVDATCGNGHDTLELARLVGPSGCVVALDIQVCCSVPAFAMWVLCMATIWQVVRSALRAICKGTSFPARGGGGGGVETCLDQVDAATGGRCGEHTAAAAAGAAGPPDARAAPAARLPLPDAGATNARLCEMSTRRHNLACLAVDSSF